MQVIAFGVGNIGRHRDAARRHDREIGDQPLGPVFRNQQHPVASVKSKAAQRFGQQADLLRHFGPALRLPFAIVFGPQEWSIAARIGAFQEKLNQVPALRQV